jgi:transketolase
MRQQFAKTVFNTLEQDQHASVLIGDISHYLLKDTEAKYPKRFYNLGICEQSLVGLAAGMAMSGMRPIVHTIAPFCVERAYEQIKIDLCYQKADVTIVSVGSSFDYASLGCTHHCYSDISILRPLKNMQIFTPGSSKEFDEIFSKTWGNGQPKYFKLSTKEHSLESLADPFEINQIKSSDSKKLIVTAGHLIDDVIAADLDANIVYLNTLSQISEKSQKELTRLISASDELFVIEENSIIGGLGDLVIDVAIQNCAKIPPKIDKIGIPLTWLTNYGTASQHRENLGLTAQKIREKIK